MESQETIARPFYIGDTETTGLKNKRACEVGLLKIDPVTFDVIEEINSLIDPEQPIEPGAAKIHGITDEMVANEPTMAQFIKHRLNGGIAGEITLICHNVPFDLPLLEPIGYVARTICSLFEARQVKHLLPGLQDCKLQTLREYFGIPANSAHHALDDCHITRQVLQKLCGITGRTLEQLAEARVRDVHFQPWGEHAGKAMHEVPRSYLSWMCGLPDLEPNLKRSAEKALAMK